MLRHFWTNHYGSEVELRYRMFCLCTLLGTVTILMSVGLNFLVFPIAFFASGGLYSVAPMFFVMGIFISLPLLRGTKRIVLFSAEMAYYAAAILLCASRPELSFLRPVEVHSAMLLFSFIIVVFYIFSSTIMVTRQYEVERQKTARLNEMLAEQATRRLDSTTAVTSPIFWMGD